MPPSLAHSHNICRFHVKLRPAILPQAVCWVCGIGCFAHRFTGWHLNNHFVIPLALAIPGVRLYTPRMIHEGDILWTPTERDMREANIAQYMRWLAQTRGLRFESYDHLHAWSVKDIGAFWRSICDYFEVIFHHPPTCALSGAMPAARWFEGATLNYAEHVFRNATDARPAALFCSETRGAGLAELSWRELEQNVAAIAQALHNFGAQPGDRVAAYAPNIPETLVAFLACASIGAVWSSCSPDLGAQSVLDRFAQIEPVILFVVDGYVYGGKTFDRAETARDLAAHLPTVRHVVRINYLTEDGGRKTEVETANIPSSVSRPPSFHDWSALLAQPSPPLTFAPVAFNHPLWVLYSSGTTGLPKPIVQSQGGILLEHLKALALHSDLSAGDRFFWFTTTGWMMWNFLIGGLLVGATPVLFDGSPGHPDMNTLWQLAQNARVNVFGASAAYVSACMKAGVTPSKTFDVSALRCFGSTGSPLSVEGFVWLYENVKNDLWLASVSGGTDVCTAFVGSCPLLPVRAGELQCRYLGADVQAWSDAGQPVTNEVGELVIAQPMPSMPIYFWNDPGFKRYTESYFEMFPGIWRHGDWIKITPQGGCVIYGRSDATINRQGVRIGTSEIYRAVEDVPEVADSLVVDLEVLGRPSYMPLFVVLRDGAALDENIKDKIRKNIRAKLSARQLPDDIFVVPEIPKTLNGKKMEVPVKRILLGHPLEKAVNMGSMANPRALDFFVEMAKRLKTMGDK